MRLQSAIFVIEDTVFDPPTPPEFRVREGLDKTLSILKMEGVWMYAVTALPRAEAKNALEQAGILSRFRGILTEEDGGCAASSGTMFEKAARRMGAKPHETVVFAGKLGALQNAKSIGFRTAAVKGAANAVEWEQMKKEADEIVESYAEFLR